MPTAAPHLAAIVAMASNRVIGRDGTLPWHFPEDLKFFKRTTLGHPILMGRATFESIGRPLPGRQNIVLSSTLAPRDGITLIRSLTELPSLCPDLQRIFVIGGARLFEELLPFCSELFLTFIDEPYEGDVLLPAFEHLFDLEEILHTSPPLEFRRYKRNSTPLEQGKTA
jgi:dihydrofolate reductase